MAQVLNPRGGGQSRSVHKLWVFPSRESPIVWTNESWSNAMLHNTVVAAPIALTTTSESVE